MKTKWEAAIPRPTGAVETLCRLLEFPEPKRQPVAIRAILRPPRHLDQCASDPFEPEFEKRTIMDFEQPIRDVDVEIGVDPDSGEHQRPHDGSSLTVGRSRRSAAQAAHPMTM